VWGVLTEQSIGKLFLAGVLPGFVLVAFFVVYILWVAVTKPELVGAGPTHAKLTAEMSTREVGQAAWSTMTVILVVVLTLGGIWLGFFTPTEGAGVGAVLSLVFALMKGMKPRAMFEVVLSVGRTSAPLLLLLFTAQLYSRVLSMTGVTKATQDLFLATGFGPYGVLALMVMIWFVLGCLIDSISIILLTVPVFAPIAGVLGFDPLAFAMIGILAIETGFLTPPFGLVVFTVKAALPEEDTTVGEIFKGSTPYWVCLLGVIVCIVFFPGIATWLPELSTKVIVGN
jgi:C4-dicarboxylate transporter, DctM subunit